MTITYIVNWEKLLVSNQIPLTKEQSKVYQINYTTLNNLLAPIVVVGLIIKKCLSMQKLFDYLLLSLLV